MEIPIEYLYRALLAAFDFLTALFILCAAIGILCAMGFLFEWAVFGLIRSATKVSQIGRKDV